MPLSKPVSPLWQPGKAPAGCKLYLPLAEGAGTTVRDYAGGLNGSFVGSPAWQRGLYGPQLGGFTTSNYVAIDPPTQLLGTVYPFWMAVLAICPVASTGSTVAFGAGNSSTNTQRIDLNYGNSGAGVTAGTVCYFLRDDANNLNSSGPFAAVGCNDGKPHVFMAWSNSPSDHRIAWDGVQVGATTNVVGAITLNRMTVGSLRRSTVIQPFEGPVLWAGAGNGFVPAPLALAQDLLSGRFAAVRPRSNLALWAALAGGSPAPFVGSPAAIMLSGF